MPDAFKYYAKNYAGIIGPSLPITSNKHIIIINHGLVSIVYYELLPVVLCVLYSTIEMLFGLQNRLKDKFIDGLSLTYLCID